MQIDKQDKYLEYIVEANLVKQKINATGMVLCRHTTQQTLTEQLILGAGGVGVIQELPAQKALFFQNKS